MDKGKLYLIPTPIAREMGTGFITKAIKDAIEEINIFIVENVRTSRRHIKKIYKQKDLNKVTFFEHGKHNKINPEKDLLSNILLGKNIGILSEAGLPCIADPGSEIVLYAHKFQIEVIPLSGPSSIFLALMSSGLNGQDFTFHGYLPIEKKERKQQLRNLEQKVKKTKQTQIFIETPYRNNQLLETILKTCNNNLKLCIASNITSNNQYIKTKTIGEWKMTKANFHKKPVIFLIG